MTEDKPLVVRRVGPPILISRAEYDELVFDGWDGVARAFWDELGARAAALYSHALVPPAAGRPSAREQAVVTEYVIVVVPWWVWLVGVVAGVLVGRWVTR